MDFTAFGYEYWVIQNYVLKNPRLITITERINSCSVTSNQFPVIAKRYIDMKDNLTKIYCSDPNIKKKWKTLQAVKKLAETNI